MKIGFKIDGVVVDPVSDDVFIDWMCTSKLPFVVIGRYSFGEKEVLSVDADNCNIAYEATKLLLQKGHREILFNLGPRHYTSTEDYLLGIKKATDQFGIKEGVHFCFTPYEMDEHSSTLKAALKIYPKLTAIVCASE